MLVEMAAGYIIGTTLFNSGSSKTVETIIRSGDKRPHKSSLANKRMIVIPDNAGSCCVDLENIAGVISWKSIYGDVGYKAKINLYSSDDGYTFTFEKEEEVKAFVAEVLNRIGLAIVSTEAELKASTDE